MKRISSFIAVVVVSAVAQGSGIPTLSQDLFADIASNSGAGNNFEVAGAESSLGETCTPVPRIVGIKYSDGDKDSKLCKYNFYESAAEGKNILTATCPKMHSTSPAMEVYKFENKETGENIEDLATLRAAKAKFEATQCKKHSQQRAKEFMAGIEAKKLAKLKTSISCSYTPAILAYYQISQILGGVAGVPPSVIRAMDAKKHEQISKQGVNYINAMPAKQRGWLKLNHTLWKQFSSLHRNKNNPRALKGSARADLQQIFTRDKSQIMGAMIKNPSGEQKFKTFRGSSVHVGRNENAKKVANRSPIRAMLSKRSKASAAAEILEMQGISDMLLLDYILIQQDRANNGNVHYVPMAMWLSEEGSLEKKRLKSKALKKVLGRSKVSASDFNRLAAEEISELRTKGKIPAAAEVTIVREIVAKDNDCGGSERRGSPNDKATVAQVEAFGHLNKKTYLRLQWLASEIDNLKEHFQKNMFFTDRDFKTMKDRTVRIARIFREKCDQGRLHLDLSPKAYLRGETVDSRAHCGQAYVPGER